MICINTCVFRYSGFGAKLCNRSLKLYGFGIILHLKQQSSRHGTGQRCIAQSSVIRLQCRRDQAVIRGQLAQRRAADPGHFIRQRRIAEALQDFIDIFAVLRFIEAMLLNQDCAGFLQHFTDLSSQGFIGHGLLDRFIAAQVTQIGGRAVSRIHRE
ncbi:hypothetical protein D3C75_1064630 [compost metagenome]